MVSIRGLRARNSLIDERIYKIEFGAHSRGGGDAKNTTPAIPTETAAAEDQTFATIPQMFSSSRQRKASIQVSPRPPTFVLFIVYLAAFHSMYYLLIERASSGVRYSLNYAPDMAEVGRVRDARLRYSEAALRALAEGGGVKHGRGGGGGSGGGGGRCERPTFCVGVVGTEGRLDRRYLLQSVASLVGLGGVGGDCRTEELFVQLRREPGGAATDGGGDVELITRAGIRVDVVGDANAPAPSGNHAEKADRWVREEVSDYAGALKKCQDSGADYAVVIEEDVRSTLAFIDKLER